MIIRLIHGYSLKLVFAVTLLLGIQIPSFLQQYEHRVDAHYQESQRQLNQLQIIADLYFSGDLQALLKKHQNSDIALFKTEASLIENTLDRFTDLQVKKMLCRGLYIVACIF